MEETLIEKLTRLQKQYPEKFGHCLITTYNYSDQDFSKLHELLKLMKEEKNNQNE